MAKMEKTSYPSMKIQPLFSLQIFLNCQDPDNISRFPSTTPFHISLAERSIHGLLNTHTRAQHERVPHSTRKQRSDSVTCTNQLLLSSLMNE